MPQEASDPNPKRSPGAGARRFLAIGPPLLALLVAGLIMHLTSRGRPTNFEELALGTETTAVFAREGDTPIHCMDLRDLDACLAGIYERSSPRVGLWLGNSQLHAINQYRAGDQTAPALLFRSLRGAGIDLLTLSTPNANLQEHYVLFEHVRSRVPLRLVILPVVFDDLREDGLRATVEPALRDQATRAALEQSAAGAELLRHQEVAPVAENDLAGLEATVQERTEKALNDWLDGHSELWAGRPEVRGALFRGLHHTRNTLFGITAQSTRRLIPARYERNLAALEGILEASRRAQILALVYVVPLRHDVDIPYDTAEYEAFKRTVRERAERNGAHFEDLEALVPAQFWGSTESAVVGGEAEVDFMHFQAPGHELLAEAIAATLRNGGGESGS